MKQLDAYLALQKEIFEYFGYVEDWKAIPIDDRREMYWFEDGNVVGYSQTEKVLESREDEDDAGYYEDEIYKQRFLPKWVYRGKDFTMICVDPHVDGNKFLAIFSNNRECPESA